MEEYVSKSQIIKELDGAEDWTYKYIEPVPGENDMMKDIETRDKLLLAREEIVKDYEKVVLDWIHESGDAAAIKTRRHELANTLRTDYWRLDPYIRARSYYDRSGMINPGGMLQFYPGKTTAPAAAVTVNGTAKPIETSADDID